MFSRASFPKILGVFLISVLLAGTAGVIPVHAASYVVDSLNDSISGDGYCTLREAIQEANNGTDTDCPGSPSAANDTITFSVSGTITLGSTLPPIVSGAGTLTIDGSGQNIIISGDNSYRVMEVNGSADLTLQNLTIANGGAGLGGGVYNDGTLTITNSAFSSNRAADSGGGVYNNGTLTITGSSFSGNRADRFGGGVLNTGTLTITGSAFSGNRADLYGGGGVSNASGGTLTITNSAFSSNSAAFGGGVSNDSTLNYANTIIANSTSGGDCANSGTIGTNTNNLVQDGSCDASLSGDPNLGAPTGSPAYFPLNPSSPAIDAGDNTTCAALPVNNQSQNGLTRPKDGDNNGTAVCDIGSYEAPSLPPVVVAHSLQSAYTPIGPGFFTVTYNKAVSDPPGNSGADDVTNPANYLLIEKGANLAADTVSCAGGVSGDDAPQTVTAVSYNASTFTATVTLAAPLPLGNYRLFVCGTTSIVSLDNTPLNNGSDFTFDFVVRPEPTRLPATGFPMGRITAPGAPSVSYSSTDLTIEIPSLGVNAPIVGVLKSGETWEVSWLGNSVGWLEGSAFPTWAGNTVLTGHVWDADNTPGVFARIKDLKYGERIYIHAFGLKYVYEVRQNAWLWGDTRVDKVFKHEKLDWVTLLTCEGYNPRSGEYAFRRLVRAVLVEVR